MNHLRLYDSFSGLNCTQIEMFQSKLKLGIYSTVCYFFRVTCKSWVYVLDMNLVTNIMCCTKMIN